MKTLRRKNLSKCQGHKIDKCAQQGTKGRPSGSESPCSHHQVGCFSDKVDNPYRNPGMEYQHGTLDNL